MLETTIVLLLQLLFVIILDTDDAMSSDKCFALLGYYFSNYG